MDQKLTDNSAPDLDKPLLTAFLQQLNIARRKLSLYPPEHPQIATSVNSTLDILKELFLSAPVITLGIAPDALYFEQLWLDKEDPTNQEFAKYFSGLGIASISFHSGLKDSELIRFSQLLRADRNTIESSGGFEKLLDQQQIYHISVIPIDYDAFQANHDFSEKKSSGRDQLWESFLHGMHNGNLDFGDSVSSLELSTIAEIFNQRLIGSRAEREQTSQSIGRFIDNSIQQPQGAQSQTKNDKHLISLLEQLSPDAQQEFLNSAFHTLEHHRDAAPDLLQKIPSHLLQNAIAGKNRQDLNLSSRLFGLINNLANSQNSTFHRNIKTKADTLSEDMVRARLDVLFNEERQDLYMPDNYQAALYNILGDNVIGSIPDEEKEKLKAQIETQSTEQNCAAIIFELLHKQFDTEQEEAIQQNLLELSRYFLDIGDFVNLRAIHVNWSKYLYDGNSSASIFNERVLSNHAQPTFMSEVLDGVDLWEEEKHQEIADYVITVGEPYSELVIEYLGLAPKWSERQLWMQILEGIGGDAQQMIVRSLKDERWYLVRNLLIILGKDLDPNSIKVIHQLIGHPHPKVRLEVLRNLFYCNPATANRQLLKELESEDPEARLSAVQIADLSRDPTLLSVLHKNLGSDPANDTDLEFKKQTIQALTRIGNKESLPILRRILQKQGLLVSHRIKQLQAEIFQNLALFPGTSAGKLLDEFTRGKHKQLAKLAIQQRHDFTRRGK
ncbi:MAG: HEAT repeat domain-containing protein [Thermodesulfobacteriota bacterium]|nr:HEAT repeat domain-containing protein [Thermodesulfobacteriota bacterium]